MDEARSPLWLALVIGNSHLHWGAFAAHRWLGGWDTPHLTPGQGQALVAGQFSPLTWHQLGLATALPDFGEPSRSPALWVGSVVPDQLAMLRPYPALHAVETALVPLRGTYATLGVDRALTLVGAGDTYGWPVLVIDGGTALTLTAGVAGELVGGAILPGLRSQLRALHDYTAGLPLVALEPGPPPHRWATTTDDAIRSGVFYSQRAALRDFIADWWRRFPAGGVVFTGGDGPALAAALTSLEPTWGHQMRVDAQLMFWGLRVCWQQRSITL